LNQLYVKRSGLRGLLDETVQHVNDISRDASIGDPVLPGSICRPQLPCTRHTSFEWFGVTRPRAKLQIHQTGPEIFSYEFWKSPQDNSAIPFPDNYLHNLNPVKYTFNSYICNLTAPGLTGRDDFSHQYRGF
jgi:hypothetical protein